MGFREQYAADMVNLMNMGEISEQISYTPYGGTLKTIKAVVKRWGFEKSAEGMNKTLARYAEVLIANNATYGVDSVSVGMDIVSMAKVPGGAVIDWVVVEIVNGDCGSWQLRVKH